jgi:methyl-accepting chemotaxis protein
LEQAIKFFEIVAQESNYSLHNPYKFCLAFYHSFHAIIFKKQDAKGEINKYLEEAKAAIEGSKSKELLFEAVENLAKALEEVQNLGSLDLQGMKCELDSYRKYCEHATELMRDVEEKAPYAIGAIRKGLPILDRIIKELIEEIQEKAKIVCKESKGTATEDIACNINREIQKWKIGSQEYLASQIQSIIFTFQSYVPNIDENSLILNRVNQMLYEQDIVKQYILLNDLLHKIMDIQVAKKTSQISNEIKELRDSVHNLILSLDELQNPQKYLDIIQKDLAEIKNDIPEMKETIYKVLDELDSPFLSTNQKLKISIPIISSLVSYETEINVPKLVAEKIHELKNLILSFKGSGKNSNS